VRKKKKRKIISDRNVYRSVKRITKTRRNGKEEVQRRINEDLHVVNLAKYESLQTFHFCFIPSSTSYFFGGRGGVNHRYRNDTFMSLGSSYHCLLNFHLSSFRLILFTPFILRRLAFRFTEFPDFIAINESTLLSNQSENYKY